MTKIAIAEPSIMLRIGLEQLLRELPDAEVVFSTDNLGSLYARINALRPDILIVNPLLYDYAKRATIRAEFDSLPNLRLIGLVTSYIESQHQRQFAGIIELNDDLQRIKSTINQVVNTIQSDGDEPDTDPLSQPDTLQPPHITVPNMRVADGQRIPKYLLEVNTKGSSPLLESNYDNLFSPILVQYRGRRRLQLQCSQSDGHSFIPSAFIEDANPTNFNPDGSVNPDFLSLTTSGQGSVGELFLRPYHDFMARQEKFRFQALVPAHLFLLIRQLLLPQDGPVTAQTRWILIDGSRFLPSSITYEFSSADLVTVSIDCSRPHIDT